MDAYLSQEAMLSINALSLLSSKSDGLLIGHKRGHRFFVEKIFPLPKSLSFSLEKLVQLNQLFQDRIIGFFSFSPDEKETNALLTPLATGKLFLRIDHKPTNKMDFKPFVIEYDEKFHLRPIRMKATK
jgi:hypothetical protein